MHWMQRQKPQLSAKNHFWKNKEKNGNNCIAWKKWLFLAVFFSGFFSRNGILKSAEVFCVAFSASKPFFWAILINNLTFYFNFSPHGPLWFRTPQKLTTPLKMAKNHKHIFVNRITNGSIDCLKGWIKIRISLLAQSTRSTKSIEVTEFKKMLDNGLWIKL